MQDYDSASRFRVDFVGLLLPKHIMMLCAIWYHMYNLKNVKNTHGGVLLLKVTLLNGRFSRFLIAQMVPNRAKRLM